MLQLASLLLLLLLLPLPAEADRGQGPVDLADLSLEELLQVEVYSVSRSAEPVGDAPAAAASPACPMPCAWCRA